MGRVFEDDFTDIQTEMVQIGLDITEKVSEKVERIYLLFFRKDYEFSACFFVKAGNQIKKWNQVSIEGGFDTYINTFYQREYEQSEHLQALFKANGRPCPEEIRLVYDLVTEEFDAEYGYDVPVGIDMDDLSQVWFDELQAECADSQQQTKNPTETPQVSRQQESARSKKAGFRFPFFWKK